MLRAVIAQSVQRLATGWTVRGWIPGAGEISRTRPDRPWGPPSLLYNRYWVSFPGVKQPESGVDHPLHLAQRLKKEEPSLLGLGWNLHLLYIFRIMFVLQFMTVISNSISIFSYRVTNRVTPSTGWQQLSCLRCVCQHFTCSNNVQQQGRRKVCRLKCHHLPSHALCLQFAWKTVTDFSLATYSNIMEQDGCHHCLIWWMFWIEIRIKTYRPKIWLLWWYDAENNVSTSASFVSFVYCVDYKESRCSLLIHSFTCLTVMVYSFSSPSTTIKTDKFKRYITTLHFFTLQQCFWNFWNTAVRVWQCT